MADVVRHEPLDLPSGGPRVCGLCRSPIEPGAEMNATDPNRCPCGRHAITRLYAGGTLVHREDCDAGGRLDCECAPSLVGVSWEPESECTCAMTEASMWACAVHGVGAAEQ